MFETRTRISFSHSRASRREREFLSLNLVLRDEKENFFLSISCFETRTRISFFNLGLRDENENRDYDNSRENFREMNIVLGMSMTNNVKLCKQVNEKLRVCAKVIFSVTPSGSLAKTREKN